MKFDLMPLRSVKALISFYRTALKRLTCFLVSLPSIAGFLTETVPFFLSKTTTFSTRFTYGRGGRRIQRGDTVLFIEEDGKLALSKIYDNLTFEGAMGI